MSVVEVSDENSSKDSQTGHTRIPSIIIVQLCTFLPKTMIEPFYSSMRTAEMLIASTLFPSNIW